MSNDSNEGNDTAAAAFQVGDRVRFDWYGVEHEGVLAQIHDNGWARVQCEYAGYHPHVDRLILISRATPAPAPAQTFTPGQRVCVVGWHYPGSGHGTVIEGDPGNEPGLIEITFDDGDTARGVFLPEQLAPICLRCGGYLDEDQRATHSELCYRCLGEVGDPASDPAAPTPAATPPALETHTLALEVTTACIGCQGTGVADDDVCFWCDGAGWLHLTVYPSDEALDRLAGELLKRISKRVNNRMNWGTLGRI